MVQCEMCGTETQSPNTIKVEGAELDVCDECTDFGTEVTTADSTTSSTKYSTGDSSSGASGGSATTSSTTGSSGGGASSGGGGGSRRDMFDEMDELAQDFDQRIRAARESTGLSQSELADELNEKASLIRKLEHGDHLPSDEVQRKLERELDIDLNESAGEGDAEWESDSDVGEYTLGDVVERKDS